MQLWTFASKSLLKGDVNIKFILLHVINGDLLMDIILIQPQTIWYSRYKLTIEEF